MYCVQALARERAAWEEERRRLEAAAGEKGARVSARACAGKGPVPRPAFPAAFRATGMGRLL